ncbi:aminotransferase class V-fold PLP-dependent enzyme [Campylobacter ureolyticus]|uniref:aminotransferase class V-fold PLP-dependent enzyme n=1 Tax=Campylobacter ureolyticus TaxID=827 RepID=UPI0022B363A8|nr:aminotransferase class V-fold PLP-dependent enzyme [Campylobacter ureolyticus]MCZ6105173.1 aminotransferase class V-fold PLP-dependent enzyme [Campylobacter ureolyticus]MCZ6157784.1 aminotransferase class V-fold PLP-dependent enzyme [Campylobacter ureolyticus]
MKINKEDIILKEGVFYFDWTASGLAYRPIENEILRILKTYANTHSEASEHARITSEYYEKAKIGLKNLLELDDKFYLFACGFGATAAIKKFQELMGIYIPPMSREFLKLDIKSLENLPLVLVSPYEHHSNEISYRAGLCEVKRIPLDEKGEIDFNALTQILSKNRDRKIIASFSVASNITGVLTDYKKLYLIIKAFGGIVALDAASVASHMQIDPGFYDALFISPHKLLGGVGSSGILIMKKELCVSDEPTFAAGGTVRYVDRKTQIYKIDKEKLEDAGTPGITELIRSYLAFKLRNDIGLENIEKKELELKEYFLEKILKLEDVILYAKDVKNKLPIFSFNIKGFDPYTFSTLLSQKYNVETRAGCACAGPYGHDLMNMDDGRNFLEEGKPGFVRVSINYTHEKDDIDYLISAIKAVIKLREKVKMTGGKHLC